MYFNLMWFLSQNVGHPYCRLSTWLILQHSVLREKKSVSVSCPRQQKGTTNSKMLEINVCACVYKVKVRERETKPVLCICVFVCVCLDDPASSREPPSGGETHPGDLFVPWTQKHTCTHTQFMSNHNSGIHTQRHKNLSKRGRYKIFHLLGKGEGVGGSLFTYPRLTSYSFTAGGATMHLLLALRKRVW